MDPHGIWLTLMSNIRMVEASMKLKFNVALSPAFSPMSKYTEIMY